MLWIGLGAVAVAIVCGVMVLSSRKRMRTMAGTETLPIEELQALHRSRVEAAGVGSFRYTCEVVGRALPGPDGELISPLANVPCVWYKQLVTREYERTVHTTGAHQGPDDHDNGSFHGSRREKATEVVADETVAPMFLVEDGTGKLLVDPARWMPAGVEMVLDHFHEGERQGREVSVGPFTFEFGSDDTIGYQLREWAVRSGQEVYVLVQASDASGRLRLGPPGGGGTFVLSAQSEAETVQKERSTTTTRAVIGGLGLLVGAICLAVAAFGPG